MLLNTIPKKKTKATRKEHTITTFIKRQINSQVTQTPYPFIGTAHL